jgi:hypothetical protein
MNDREPGAAGLPPTKTGIEKAPTKESDPTASTDLSTDPSADPFAEADGEDVPFDYEALPSQPEADEVLKDSEEAQAPKPATTQPSVAAKKDEKPSETASAATESDKKPE